MHSNTATFIGHSDIYSISKKDIIPHIESLIDKGVCRFLSGGMGQFDMICAGCVHDMQSSFPHIENLLVIPYLSFTPLNPDIYNDIIYPEGFELLHFKAAIPARNRYLIDNSKHALCYIDHSWGGAAKTYNYAIKNKLEIINLGNLNNI